MAIREEGTIIKFIYSETKAPVEKIVVTDMKTNIQFYAQPYSNVSLVDDGYVVIPTKYKVGEVSVDVEYSREDYVIEGASVSCEESAYVPTISSIGYHSFVLDLSDCNKQTINCEISGYLRSSASDIPLSLRLLKTPSGKLIKTKGGRLRCVRYSIDAGLPSGRLQSLSELQKANPIQVGTYLGVIYWDGKGTGANFSYIYIKKGRIGLMLRKLEINGEYFTEAGYYVIDDIVTIVEESFFVDDHTGIHITALQLRPAKIGDEIKRFYWDGTSEAWQTAKNLQTTIDGVTYEIYGGGSTALSIRTRTSSETIGYEEITTKGWHSISDISIFNKLNGVFKITAIGNDGHLPNLWIYDTDYDKNMATQPANETKAVAMLIDRNGTSIVARTAESKQKVVI